MVEQILLSSGSFAGMRETGGFGQPLHALYPQIRAVLASELGPEAAGLLAEPVVDRANNRIDWYTEGDPDHSPTALSDLPEEQRQSLLAQVHDWLERGRSVAERYAASEEPRRTQLGAMVRAALSTPTETEVFVVEGRPVMIRWGFVPDRPWETLAEPAHGPAIPPPLPKPPEPPRDVAMPEIVLPELATAATPAPVTEGESPPATGRQPEAPPAIPRPEPIPVEPLPEPPPEPVPPLSTPEPAPEPPPVLASKPSPVSAPEPPPAVTARSPLEPEPGPETGWRYVVVGSRYFWGVFALAVVLAIMAALWSAWGRSSLSPAPGQATGLALDTDLERALTQAQRTETELRARLESLVAQLASRRGQCALPSAETKTSVPVVQEPGHDRTIPAQPTVVGAVGERPRQPAETAAPTQALEEALIERTPVATAPVRQPPLGQAKPPATADLPTRTEPPTRAEPTVKAEPTPEERQEFASRLSAAGATTGEITATLLWNSSGDLDLVVRCPSGQQLDYRNPAMCGGALDVDANAARASLSNRPVENAFWPAGRATPGTYEIAVRYAPRKDEQNPQKTPFQVRLIRGSQESVFKGEVRPNTVTSVTTFTVTR